MPQELRRQMVFHGAVVVLIGMLAGFPFALVLTGDLVSSERAWRMAHLEGLLNGLVLLAVAGITDQLALPGWWAWLLSWALIVTGYGNVIASILGAIFSVRGLTSGGSVMNTLVYLLFVVAVVGILVGMGLVAAGARTPVREEAR